MNTIRILLDDPTFVVIDKPAGMVVNRAENVTEDTVQDWAEKNLAITQTATNDQEEAFFARAGIVHRLDKETSGILLIAKNPAAFLVLQGQFFRREVQKKYLALVHGVVTPADGTVRAPVGRLPWNRRKFGVISEGREAVTGYHVTNVFSYQGASFSLLEVSPETGRTHQIRIHLKHLGHSLVADPLYSGKHLYEADKQFCPRLFLHATALTFAHPVTADVLAVVDPLPPDLASVIETLSPASTLP